MKRQDAEFGIYIILWFKGGWFDKPNLEGIKKIYRSIGEGNLNEVTETLGSFEMAMSLVRISFHESNNVREFVIDVSKPVSASKL